MDARGIALFAVGLAVGAAGACTSVSQNDPSGGGGAGAGTTTTTSTSTTSSSSSTSTTSSPLGGAGGAGGGGAGLGGGGMSAGGGGSGGAPLTVAACYADDFVNPPSFGPDYDQFHPVVGSHCLGTNHQDVSGVERVVFLGDSVTVGTPPTLPGDSYRAELAAALAQKFGLAAPGFLWDAVDIFNGTSIVREDGAFASCAKWGARTDDLMQDNTQIENCIPPAERDKRTLIIMTIGGNDISALTQHAIDGVPQADLWLETQAFVQRIEDAMAWIYAPGRFPNGVFVVFANMYEFTDGTGNVQSCDVSGLAGFGQPVPAPAELAAMVIWANEQYVRIAVSYQADVVFMLEEFCGHGFEADNPAAPCYRGPNTPLWFDLTCIHPNPLGHAHTKDMFMAVVNE